MKAWLLAGCAVLAAALPSTVLAQKAEAKKPEAKKAAARKKPAKIEKLACRLGTEDEHARIAVTLADGKVDSFAYYSKWKPRTCSMDVKRNDAYSRWADTGDTTVVTLIEDKGAFLIDHNPGRYHFIFRDIDRMRYCGMEGKVNGSLTIRKGKPQCEVSGVMDRDWDKKPEPVAAKPEEKSVEKPVAEPAASAAKDSPPVAAPAAAVPDQKPVAPAPAAAPVEKPVAPAPTSAAPAGGVGEQKPAAPTPVSAPVEKPTAPAPAGVPEQTPAAQASPAPAPQSPAAAEKK
jgi:hypothetical protein